MSTKLRALRLPLLLGLLSGLFFYLARDPASVGPGTPPQPALSGKLAAVAQTSTRSSAAAAADLLPDLAEPGESLSEAQQRLARYKQFSRYPPGSRPAREHPDQMAPFLPVVRQSPLVFGGEANDEVSVQLGQDRRELVGDETARLWVRCEDSLGKVLPCLVRQAVALPAPPTDSQVAPAPLTFLDDGQNGDDRSGDGTLTAALRPSALGFSGFSGTVRVQLQIGLGEHRGGALFDLAYTPNAPARFAATVSETVVQGSLHLGLQIEVLRPGRYFVTGRVDDARERQFALVQWDGELTQGTHKVPLTVFGKLLHDEKPTFPLVLRDVVGFLFLDDSEPDRMHMPHLVGVVHKTKVYSLADFSEAEWDSEMKRRYLEEYEKDVERTKGR